MTIFQLILLCEFVILTKLNYPKIGRIIKMEKDSIGIERDFTVEYNKTKKIFSSVKKTAKSMCLIMKKDENAQEHDLERHDAQNPIVDPILFMDEVDMKPANNKRECL